MRRDVAAHVPFADHFACHVEASFGSREAAIMCERRLIALHETQGAGGYNTLPGTLGSSPVFWMHYHKRCV
jgi:hypothetical protein